MNNTRESENRSSRIALELGLGAAGVVAATAGVGYAVARSRRAARATRQLFPAALDLPAGTRHLDVPVRDGSSIHVADWGAGRPLLFLHGVTLSSAVWAYQFHDLGQSHRTIAIDLRGHGDSQAGRAGLSIAAMADDVADLLEALDLRQTTLVGHSMGGMTLLRFVRRHPEVMAARVGAAALVASSGGIRPPLSNWHNFAPEAAALAVAGHRLFNRANRPFLPASTVGERMMRVAFGADPDPLAVRRSADIVRAMAPENLVALLPELAGFDERAAFEDLGVPAVVVVGERDRLTPPPNAEALAASLPGARLQVWPGAGHMLMYERREQLGSLLEALSLEAAGRGSGAGAAR